MSLYADSSSAMEEGSSQMTPEQQANAAPPVRVHRHKADCFDFFCRFLNITTALCALLCAVSYGMALWVYQPVQNVAGVMDQILRVAGVIGAIIIMVIETEWEPLLNLFRFAEYWVGRAALQADTVHIYRPQDHPLFEFIFRIGLLTPSFFSQIFAAMFTFKMASAAGKNCKGKDCDFHKSLELYRTIAAMALLCCGVVYLLGGVLCLGLIKRSRSNRDRKRLQAQRDLDELEEKRTQLRGLLGHPRDE